MVNFEYQKTTEVPEELSDEQKEKLRVIMSEVESVEIGKIGRVKDLMIFAVTHKDAGILRGNQNQLGGIIEQINWHKQRER
jgi:hypothetical protein